MSKTRTYDCLRGLIFYLLLETTFSLKAQAIGCKISRSAKDLVPPDKELTPNKISSLPGDDSFNSQRHTATIIQSLAPQPTASPLDLDPKTINDNPILHRWIDNVPNIAADIENDPNFRTRMGVQYLSVRSSHHAPSFNVSIKDLRLGHTHATINADFHIASNNYQTWGTDLHYYVYPPGSYINITPVAGYRNLKTNFHSTSGTNLGFRLLLVLTRGGGADISFTQTWIAPGSDEEAGLSTLSFGYALNKQVRLSTNLQRQNTKRGVNSHIGVGIEWML
ncbi:MAG: hypothetical protein LH660_19145 [Phormidesmis sp. CAN_BIN36]|nr:hypothetical protein [Phormidesmis sp. CAN_BIN36]